MTGFDASVAVARAVTHNILFPVIVECLLRDGLRQRTRSRVSRGGLQRNGNSCRGRRARPTSRHDIDTRAGSFRATMTMAVVQADDDLLRRIQLRCRANAGLTESSCACP